VSLGAAESFAVLGGQTVTNTGPTVVSGDLGVSPGSAVTGFPPGIVVDGEVHAADALAAQAQAQADLTSVYNDAAGQASDANIAGDLGGLTLTPGVYTAASSIGLTGTLTLDGQGDPNSVFIFQVGSTLTTASGSDIALINGAVAGNVYLQVGSSATLGTGSSFAGTIMALTSITVTTGVSVEGRVLARNGAVTLDTNTINRPPAALPEPLISVPVASTTVPVTATTVPEPPTTAPETLPRTGTSLAVTAATGTTMLLLGSVTLLVARRRATRTLS
jgi:type VI secretion system secreted protein VgrG